MRTILAHYLNLDSEIDKHEIIHETIEKGVIFKGTNLWILVFAILVASVGLNMNSTAVIIGAMLISPLMGPIIGMGYSIATYNFPLFRIAVKNFTFAVVVSLIASTFYFLISPVSTAHSELLARTSPTIYDVLIAFFGGAAGIVAISSKNKGNVIPGVAIATALMPPLCTAGYGLATGQLTYFFGAIYLFTINTVFIALASLFIAQLLKFPILTILEPARKKRINQWISSVITLTLIPSIYFGYSLVAKEKFNENANKFIKEVSIYQDQFLLQNTVDIDKKSISLVYGGTTISEIQKNDIKKIATDDYNIDSSRISFKQGFSLDKMSGANSDIAYLKKEMFKMNTLIKNQDVIQLNPNDIKQLFKEVQAIHPEIYSCGLTEGFSVNKDSKEANKSTVVLITQDSIKLSDQNKTNLRQFIKARLRKDDVRVIFR